MSTKVQRIAKAVREDSVGVLAREAMLRVSRRFHLSRFESKLELLPEVHYRPIGYYQPTIDQVSVVDRESILHYARMVLAGEFPMMGYGNVPLGSSPDWSRDWVSGKSWPMSAASGLTVVRHDGSDVKAPWELSRLQFLPVLAKAHLLSGDDSFREAARALAADWIDRNPVGFGVNWTIAMEAALRGISLCLLLELLWPLRPEENLWLAKVTRSLWQHLLFVEAHSEFSHRIRSNHYLSNIVGLTTLSAALRGPGTDRRFPRYARLVQQEILRQTYPDGGDYEASTGYHVLVSQMFLHSYVVQKARHAPISPEFSQRLRGMFDWMATLADSAGTLPQIGDCDDGRAELLMDDVRQASMPVEQRNSLKVASYLGLGSQLLEQNFGGAGGDTAWFGPAVSQVPLGEISNITLLPQSGVAVAWSGSASLVFYAIPNGINGRGSHTHSDKLSFVLRLDDVDVFCDSGTRGYTRDAKLRNRYRSAAAHNVVTVDGQEHNRISPHHDQLFRCGNEAAVTPIVVSEENGVIILSASHSGYSGFGVQCSRTMQLLGNKLIVTDEVDGTGGHEIAAFFQLAPEWTVSTGTVKGTTVDCAVSAISSLSLTCKAASELYLQVETSEISRAYGAALPASRISIQTTAELPAALVTTIEWKR